MSAVTGPPSTAAPPAPRRAFWLLYAAAWAPFVVLYALLIAQRGPSTAGAIAGAASTVGSAALLGVIVDWLTGRIGGPERGRFRLLTLHALGAAAFSAAWAAAVVAMLAWRAPAAVRAEFVQNSLGWQLLSGIMVYGVIAGVSTAARTWGRLREQESAAARSEALRVRAELEALRAQLDPHFVFNTLHSVTALVRSDPPGAEQAIERFGDLLRYVLDVNRDRRDEAPLADEWAFVRGYLALEELRLGQRLRVVEQLDPDLLDCLVPTFALQPLVENAIRHAIAPHARAATLTVAARSDEGRVLLEVTDDGPGTSPERALASAGVGLRVLRQRLDVLYRGAARLDLATSPGAGFAATVSLPLRAMRGAGHEARDAGQRVPSVSRAPRPESRVP